MFSKITKLNDYDKVTLIYEPTVQAKQQQSKVLSYLIILVSIAIFLLGVNFAFHFLHYTAHLPPQPASKSSTTNDDICPKGDFDYLLLSIRWPPSFCNYQRCINGSSMYDWVIHGLWPDYSDGTYPQFCCKDYSFNLTELKSIQPELEIHWKDLTTKASEHALWIHEWMKHGTCTFGNPNFGSVFKYFNTTLELFKKYNVQAWLEENDILSNPSTPYKLADIVNAIESKLGGKRIKIECDKHVEEKLNCDKADYSSGKAEGCRKIRSKVFKLIDSIDLCFDKQTLQPIDCPTNHQLRKVTCDNEVYYFRTKQELDSLKL